MTQMDYWNLDEPQRAELTEEQVRACEAYELMRAGVVRAQPPEPLKERQPLEREAFYRVEIRSRRYGGRTNVDALAFASPSEAKAWIDTNPLIVECHYFDGTYVYSVQRLAELDPGIEMFEASAAGVVDQHRAELEKYAAAQKKHSAEVAAYEKNAQAERRAIEGLWEDWYRCRELDRKHAKVVATFDEYVDLAGSRELAATFLLKAFTRTEIEAAAEWQGRTIDLPPLDEPAAEQSAPVEDAALAF